MARYIVLVLDNRADPKTIVRSAHASRLDAEKEGERLLISDPRREVHIARVEVIMSATAVVERRTVVE